jgi:hypothetical protein
MERQSETLSSVKDYWEERLMRSIADVYFVRVYHASSGRRGSRQRQVFMVGRSENIKIVRTLHQHLKTQLLADLAIAATGFDRDAAKARGVVDTYPRIAAQRGVKLTAQQSQQILAAMDPAILVDLIESMSGWTSRVSARVAAKIIRGDIGPEFIPDLGVFRRSFLISAVDRLAERLRDIQKRLVDDAGSPGTDLVVNESAAVAAYLNTLGVKLRQQKSKVRFSEEGAIAGQRSANRADLSNHKLPSSQRVLEAG